MTLTRLANACIFPSFPGDAVPDWVRRFLADGGGGIVLFAYNAPYDVCRALRAERDDVMLAIDEEGGDVTRLEWDTGSSYPGGAALGAIDDADVTEAVAASIGAELAAAGINWDLAPVADVNVPANPVIGTRAFGSDPELVARHVAAWTRGLQSRRVAACAKHFPGHGATEQDSHLELPALVGDVEEGLEPFRAAIAAGVRSIMTAHIKVHELPATVDASIIRGLLREELGFDGVVMADALEMKGVSSVFGVEQAAVRALNAGVDALCVGHDLHEEAVDSIRAALVADVPEERLREAAGRIAALAAWARPATGVVDHEVGTDAARRALRVEGDVTLNGARTIVELRPSANIAAGEAEHKLAGAVVVREGDPVPAADVYVVRDAHRHPWMRQAVDVPGTIVVEVGLPVWKPRRSRGYIASYGAGRASLAAVEEVLR
ncbi:MAG TPA: glycoside hydrolase family 3 N-terminal domain-containing protein [Gaiellaceae bacterium]|nr:glycoside hydrolase family 3 N-terminal domain-containing protein [Gaiellaceae bacterium]